MECPPRPLVSSLMVGLTLWIFAPRAVVAAGAPVPESPWLKPENAEKYVFLGKRVWDIDAGKMISQTGAPDVWETSHWIVGTNDRVFDQPATGAYPPGMTASGRIVMLNGDMPQTPSLDGKTVGAGGNGPAFWINSDHRRVIWIQGGDYWRGEIDWANQKIINRKQVTSLGAFTPVTSPLLWWGQLIYIGGGFDKAKPIVRINLSSGEVTEMERYRVWPNPPVGNGFVLHVSPSSARVFNPTESMICSYDVRTGKPSMFRNKFEIVNLAGGGGSGGLFPDYVKPIWSDDDNAYCFDQQGFLSHFDFRNSQMEILRIPPVQFPDQPQYTTKIEGVVPGTHWLDIAKLSYQDPHSSVAGGQVQHRYLFDVTTNQETPLPFDDHAMGKWITDSMYLYVLTQGGLSTVGTWVYDRTANTNKHLSSVQIDEGRMLLLPKRKLVIAISQQTGGTLIRLNLDGSPSQSLGQCGLDIPHRLPDADDTIDLGFPGSPGAQVDLWKPVAVDEQAIAATQPAEAPAGKLKLIELTKAMPAEDQAFAEACYDYATHNATLNSYCDPIQFGMKSIDLHHANPADPPGNVAFKVDISEMGDPERIAAYGQGQAMGIIRADTQLTDDQKLEIANQVGPMLVDAWQKANPKPKNGQLGPLLQQCMAQARQSVTGAAAPAAQNQSPAQQPYQQQQGQQQQQQQQHQTNQTPNPQAPQTHPPAVPHPPHYNIPNFRIPGH